MGAPLTPDKLMFYVTFRGNRLSVLTEKNRDILEVYYEGANITPVINYTEMFRELQKTVRRLRQ